MCSLLATLYCVSKVEKAQSADSTAPGAAMFLKRLSLGLLTVLVSIAAFAQSVEERSPFRQGHWWDPTRPGHGFEILNVGEIVSVVWYTYDAMERPVWYTAQGTLQTMGEVWPVQKHR